MPDSIFSRRSKSLIDYFFEKLKKVEVEVETEEKPHNYKAGKESSTRIRFNYRFR